MPKRKPISKETLVNVATDAIAGISKRALMTKYPAVSERVIRTLMQNDVGVEEWRAAVLKEIQATAGEALLELRRAIRDGRLSANSLPIALGILIDKSAALDARNVGTVSINAQINNFNGPMPREKLIDALRGLHPTNVLAASGDSGKSILGQTSANDPKP